MIYGRNAYLAISRTKTEKKFPRDTATREILGIRRLIYSRTEPRRIIELISIDLFRLFSSSQSLKIIPQKFHLQSDRQRFHFANFLRRHFLRPELYPMALKLISQRTCSVVLSALHRLAVETVLFSFQRVRHQTKVRTHTNYANIGRAAGNSSLS